ncbi:hypothetical protein ACFQU2_27620 [Siccirubricoccus deserti]
MPFRLFERLVDPVAAPGTRAARLFGTPVPDARRRGRSPASIGTSSPRRRRCSPRCSSPGWPWRCSTPPSR